MITKKDIRYSLVAGFLTGVCALLVFSNVQTLSFLEKFKVAIVFVTPLIFLIGFFVLAGISKIPKLSIIQQIGKFGMVGILNTMVDFGILNLLIAFTGITSGISLAYLNGISFSVAVVNSFFWNRFWVFGEQQSVGGISGFFRFLLISVIAVGLNSAIVTVLATFVHAPFGLDQKTWINLAKIFATLFSLVWNFLGYKFIGFKKS